MLWRKRGSAEPPSLDDLEFWAIEEAPQYSAYVDQAYKAGRTCPAPDRARMRGPGVFDSAIGWGEDIAGSAIENYYEAHRSEYVFVSAHWHLLHDTATRPVAVTDVATEREARRLATEAALAGQARGQYMALYLAERKLDAGLKRLEGAIGRLLADMKTAFAKGWFFREQIERVDIPSFDVTTLHYNNRSGINVPAAFSGALVPAVSSPPAPSAPAQLAAALVEGDEDDEDANAGVL